MSPHSFLLGLFTTLPSCSQVKTAFQNSGCCGSVDVNTTVSGLQIPHVRNDPIATMQNLSPYGYLFYSQAQQQLVFSDPSFYPFSLFKPVTPDFSKAVDFLPSAVPSPLVDDALRNYMATNKADGLLILKKGEVVLEEYRDTLTRDMKHITYSETKSITSILIGVAINDGYITSVNDLVTDYLPALASGPYNNVTIEQVLTMSSGVGWNEDYYDPASDVNIVGGSNDATLIPYLNGLNRSYTPGTRWIYNTGETNLVGSIVRAAIKPHGFADMNTYLQAKVWGPAGITATAMWPTDLGGEELTLGGCCMYMTLRDKAKLFRWAVVNDGTLLDGTPVIAPGYMTAALTGKGLSYAGQFDRLPFDYGYLMWTLSGDFVSRGIFGQTVFIDKVNDIVMAQFSTFDSSLDSAQWGAAAAMWTTMKTALS